MPVSGAPEESLSRRRLVMSFKTRRASSILCSATVEAYSRLPMGEPSTICPDEEIWDMEAPSEANKLEPKVEPRVLGLTSRPHRIEDFPLERLNPIEDRRQSREREASRGGDGCRRLLRARATVEGGPTIGAGDHQHS